MRPDPTLPSATAAWPQPNPQEHHHRGLGDRAALVCVTPSAGAAVTYRSAGGVCETASLYANYSASGGPKNKIGVVVLGEVVGFVESGRGP